MAGLQRTIDLHGVEVEVFLGGMIARLITELEPEVGPPLRRAAAHPTTTFGIFFLLNIASLIFVARFAPETKGRTEEGTEQEFRTKYA